MTPDPPTPATTPEPGSDSGRSGSGDETGADAAAPPPDIYARIRHYAPVLVVLFCAGLLVMVAVLRPFDSPPAAPELRDPLVGADADPTAAYVIIDNAGGNDTLIGASSPAAATVEIQERQGVTATDAGELVVVDELAVPGYTETRLQPGADQLLLTDLIRPLQPGDSIELTLEFERAGTLTVDAEVAPYLEIADRLLPPRLIIPGQGENPAQPGQ